MNGEDLNGNGEEQNGHLEEFNFRKRDEAKCGEEEDVNHDALDEILRTKWNNKFPSDVSSVVTPETESVDNDDGGSWKTTKVSELESSVESSTQTIVSASDLAV